MQSKNIISLIERVEGKIGHESRSKKRLKVDRRELRIRLHSLMKSNKFLMSRGVLTPMHGDNYEQAIKDVLNILRKL